MKPINVLVWPGSNALVEQENISLRIALHPDKLDPTFTVQTFISPFPLVTSSWRETRRTLDTLGASREFLSLAATVALPFVADNPNKENGQK